MPNFKLKITPTSKTNASLLQKQKQEREQQLKAAVQYCLNNNCKGYTAVKSGKFPLIKDHRTINKRLNGGNIGLEKEYCSILTKKEEESLVRFCKNKSRSLQPVSRKELTIQILNALAVRKHLRTTSHGRMGKRLSVHAEKALLKKKLSKSFWKRFHAANPSLTMKRPGNTSINRALNCTKDMAIRHLGELADELIESGIFTEAEQVEPGVWTGNIDTSRIFNHDETPQFVNYGVDGTQGGLVYCGKGQECKQLIQENRECVTLMPYVSCSGELVACQVIFKGKGITSQMVPPVAAEKIPHLLISTTDSGIQDHTSLLESYRDFNDYLVEAGIQKPVVLLSDGHSSRFDESVLQFLQDVNIRLFIGPPDTTGVTQLLDQINQSLHTEYRNSKSQLFSKFSKINREGFMLILAELWGKWTTPEKIVNAARQVGITSTGLNVSYMQQSKFEQARAVLEDAETEESASSSLTSMLETPSPVNTRKGSAQYYKKKVKSLQGKVASFIQRAEIDLEGVPGFYQNNTPGITIDFY